MNDVDLVSLLEKYAERTAQLVVAQLRQRPEPVMVRALPARFTVDEFAWVIQSHPVTVRRYVRENHHGLRSKGHVSKDTPYKIDVGALALFSVTPEAAARRLAERPLAAPRPAAPPRQGSAP